MERCQSGLLGHPAKMLHGESRAEGSNPSLSSLFRKLPKWSKGLAWKASRTQ